MKKSPQEPAIMVPEQGSVDSLQLLEHMIQQTSDGILVLSEDLKVVLANTAALKATGYRVEEDLESYCYRAPGNLEVPCQPPDDICAVLECKKSGHPVMVEHVYSDPKGNRSFVEVKVEPIKNNNGATYYLHITRDITARKQAEEKLALNNIILRTQMESSVEGIVVVDEKGEISSYNQRIVDMWGVPPDIEESKSEALAQQWVLDKLADPEEFIRKMQSLREAREATSQDEIALKDGRVFDRYSAPMLGPNQRYYGRVWYFRDITRRKQTEERLSQMLLRLKEGLAGTMEVISQTVELRDPYTAGHQRRVSRLATAIAQELGLSHETTDNIQMAALIHDLGKIAVPAEILTKPGRLSPAEFELIKVHPQTGFTILKDAKLPEPVAQTVLQHHERLDGSGYPDGLKGEAILHEARILAVADVVEAMTSQRPYRPGLGIDQALAEIEKNLGVLYDQAVVEACLAVFKRGYRFN